MDAIIPAESSHELSVILVLESIGVIMGCLKGDYLSVENELDTPRIVVPQSMLKVPRFDDWMRVLCTYLNLDKQIGRLYGVWDDIKSCNTLEFMDSILEVRIDALQLYNSLLESEASISDCWGFLDRTEKKLLSASTVTSFSQARLVEKALKRSAWNSTAIFKSYIINIGDVDGKALLKEIHELERLSEFSVEYSSPFACYRSCQSFKTCFKSKRDAAIAIKNQKRSLYTSILKSDPRIISAVVKIFDITLFNENRDVYEIYAENEDFLLGTKTLKAEVRKISTRLKDYKIELLLDGVSLEDLLMSLNNRTSSAAQKSSCNLEYVSITLTNKAVKAILGSELLFKLQVLFRFQFALHFILFKLESVQKKYVDSSSSQKIYILADFLRQYLLAIKVDVSEKVLRKNETIGLEQWHHSISDLLHEIFSRSLLSNGKSCECFSSIIGMYVELIGNLGDEKSVNVIYTLIIEKLKLMIENWKDSSLRGDNNMDRLLQRMDCKYFDSFRN